jgi:hypothetical protein
MYNLEMANAPECAPERRRVNAANIESSVDKQIREAIERGEFENLRGEGKPLNLTRDPNVPKDWDLAFNLLKNSGFAPDWIELSNEIRATREKLHAPLHQFAANAPADPKERERRAKELGGKFRIEAAELNRAIDTYNLKAPSPQVHIRRIRIEHDLNAFFESLGIRL